MTEQELDADLFNLCCPHIFSIADSAMAAAVMEDFHRSTAMVLDALAVKTCRMQLLC